MIEQCRNVIYHVFFSGITTEQQKKTWLINWYFANDPMGSIYLATLRNPALVASYQTSPGMLYGANGATGMETYFIKIKTHFGQSMFDQLVTEFAQQSNLYVDEIKVDEWHLYGCSDALHGVDIKRVARDLNLDNQITSNEYVIETPEEVTYLFSSYQLERGAKRYELANHLGNVLTVISDKKTAVFTCTTFNYFAAERISATDYSPFGAPLASRSWNGGEYRFGFQRQENDNEIFGDGNSYSFEYRIHNSRLGRFLSVDPLIKKYPALSTYAFSGNVVINAIEIEGLEPGVLFKTMDDAANNFGQLYNDNSIRESQEYGATIYKVTNDGEVFYAYSKPALGGGDAVTPSIPFGEEVVADIHTHGSYDPALGKGNNRFSEDDLKSNRLDGIIGYVVTPDGALRRYDPLAKDGYFKTINLKQPSDPGDPTRLNNINACNMPGGEPTYSSIDWFNDKVLFPLLNLGAGASRVKGKSSENQNILVEPTNSKPLTVSPVSDPEL